MNFILKRKNKNKLNLNIQNFERFNFNNFASNYKEYLNLINYKELLRIVENYE